MKLSSLCDKLAAILRRDLLTAIRYRPGFMLAATGALAELAAFYYLSRAIGPGFRPEGMGYFPFLLVGTGFYTFLVMGVLSFVAAVQEAQQNGTLEVLMTTSTPPPVLVFLSAISAFAGNTVNLVFYLVVGLLVFDAPLRPNLAGCIVIFALSMAIAIAIGIFAAAVQLATQKSLVLDGDDVPGGCAAEDPSIFIGTDTDYTFAGWHASGASSRRAFFRAGSRNFDPCIVFDRSSAIKSRNFLVYFASCPATRHSLFLLICFS